MSDEPTVTITDRLRWFQRFEFTAAVERWIGRGRSARELSANPIEAATHMTPRERAYLAGLERSLQRWMR